MRKSLRLAAMAGLALIAAGSASAASYSSRSFSSSSYSSSSRSYSSSYSSRPSYSAPSYSAPRPSVSPAPSSAYRPAPAYSVRSTTVTSSYTPAGKVGATTSRSYTAAPSSTTINHTTVIHSAPVVVHQYGYPGGYYHSGYDAFWHGYFLASMFHQPGYGPMYAQPMGAQGGYGPVVASPGMSPLAATLWTLGLLLLVVFVIVVVTRAFRDRDDW